ncbi:unnamed protein product, partial [Chrysoparadoxa australica]
CPRRRLIQEVWRGGAAKKKGSGGRKSKEFQESSRSPGSRAPEWINMPTVVSQHLHTTFARWRRRLVWQSSESWLGNISQAKAVESDGDEVESEIEMEGGGYFAVGIQEDKIQEQTEIERAATAHLL